VNLKRLPDRVKPISIQRVPLLETKAGATPRIRGDAWMKIRRATLLAAGFACRDCGLVRLDNEIDHDTPLEQGGSNDPSNLVVRCIPCHAAKTKTELRTRYGK
jgi:5-methylcytosine-specific restriction protein A